MTRVIDLVAEGETLAIVMELIDGLDLRRELTAKGTLPPAQAARYGRELLGIARLTYGGSLTRLTSVIGTPEYMAPEIVDHESATAAVRWLTCLRWRRCRRQSSRRRSGELPRAGPGASWPREHRPDLR